MSFYSEIIYDLIKKDFIKELYRFQGAYSYDYYNTKTSSFNITPNDSYVYLSGSLDHHKYFSIKRIKQLINRDVLRDTPYRLSNKYLSNIETYSKKSELGENPKETIRKVVEEYERGKEKVLTILDSRYNRQSDET